MNIRHSVIRSFGQAVVFLCLPGCFTVSETEHPTVVVGALPPDKDMKVQISGFDAVFTTYDTAYNYGTATSFGGGWCDWRGHYRYGGLGTSTYSSTTYIPRREATAAFRDRATDTLERAGCIVRTKEPQYGIDVKFEGPYAEPGDGWAEAGWIVLTIFTADFDAQNWVAKLRIHDLKTGKLVHQKDFAERDSAIVWGPIPIFSPACASRTSADVLKTNCLAALTDRAVAEAIAFLSKQ